MQGWIKLYRKLLENCISDKPEYLALWIHLLLLANHLKETSFIWNNSKQTLKSGQFITGRKELSKKTGISESSVYRILNYLENEHQIEQQKNNQFTLVTILNWEKYQQDEQQNEQPVNNQRTTSEQPVNTFKNDKNDKNDKKGEQKKPLPTKRIKKKIKDEESETLKLKGVDTSDPKCLINPEIINILKIKFPNKNIVIEISKMVDYLKSQDKAYNNYLAFARNWLRKDFNN